jgi:DNA-binding transcriptional ArsR family regulator
MSIARLTDGADVTRQAVTKHLRVLEGAGLVRGRRAGRAVVWDVERERLAAARAFLDLMSAWWDDVLGRMKASIEDD